MRRLLRSALWLVALGAGSSLGAQTVDVGVKGGWVRPTLAGKAVQDTKARNTVGGGGFLSFALTPELALQPEVLYLAKGAGASEQGATVQLHIGYIEVPLLVRIAVPVQRGAVQPYLLAGPAVAFRGKCEATASEGTTSMTVSCDDPLVQGDVKKVDWSLTGGAGLALPLGKLSALLEARYDYGLTKLDKATPPDDVKNRAFMVFAGFSVPLGNVGHAAAARSR